MATWASVTIFGTVIATASQNMGMFIAARFITGFGSISLIAIST